MTCQSSSLGGPEDPQTSDVHLTPSPATDAEGTPSSLASIVGGSSRLDGLSLWLSGTATPDNRWFPRPTGETKVTTARSPPAPAGRRQRRGAGAGRWTAARAA